MVKKISTLALAGLLALPAMASAGAGGAAATSDMQAQIDALTKQLNNLKAQMADIKTSQDQKFEEFGEKADKWDLASRIQLSGDFRARMDYVTADAPAHYTALDIGAGVGDFMATGNIMNRYDANNGGAATVGAFMNPATGFNGTNVSGDGTTTFTDSEKAALGRVVTGAGALLGGFAAFPIAGVSPTFTNMEDLVDFMKTFTPAQRAGIFAAMGYNPAAAADYDNDTIWTNRFRMDIRAKALENVEFKGRLAMYKAWGMQNNPADYSANNGLGGGPFALAGYMSDFDGATTRNPNDSILRVDRAFVNWNNIGGAPVWFSVGRRPTTDGPPANLKLGTYERLATPTAVMDWPFDGISVGYAYNNLFGLQDAPGRVRVCYGRGFESGPDTDSSRTLNDVDFAGVSWDIYKKGNRFFYLQSFGAFNVFNVPDNVNFGNPVEFALWKIDPNQYDPTDPSKDLLLSRANLGNIYHTSAVYMDKYQKLNYFAAGAWSRTDVNDQIDEMGTSLLGSFFTAPKDRSGYHFHAGVRYDLDDYGLKLGAEYNYGSKYWIAMTPGHDDLYASKLATRGNVYEIYGIYDIPGGEAVSKYGKAWMRLGYQHYDYEYTGSGFWLGKPLDVDKLSSDPLAAQFYTPVDSMDQVYLTFEASF